MTEKEKQNRLRCLNCNYYAMNGCNCMVDSDVSKIDICIKDIIRTKSWNCDSPEMFMFRYNPVMLLSYLSYCRRNILPKVGCKVLTLREGFTGGAGVFRKVVEITDTYIVLSNKEGRKSISYIDKWFYDIFVFDSFN